MQLLDRVAYTDSQGRIKAALVIGTPDSIDPEGSAPDLAEGQLHLYVISPTGRTYTRQNVPARGSVEGVDAGEQRGCWDAIGA